MDTLHLPTPDSFPAFPYQPYDIQFELMKNLYTALEGRKIAILESPTGTVCRPFRRDLAACLLCVYMYLSQG